MARKTTVGDSTAGEVAETIAAPAASEAIGDIDYYNEIEAHFALLRGTPFVVSAKDWALMKSWREAGVPLPVVIEAIDSVFEKNETSGRKKVISSLSYCRHAVKELWDERRELSVGEAGQAVEVAPGDAVRALVAELERSASEAARSFAPRVAALTRKRSVPAIEESLIEIEREMIDAIVANLSPADRAGLEREIARALGDTARLDEKTRARTEEANLRRVVRERFELPRLTLFR